MSLSLDKFIQLYPTILILCVAECIFYPIIPRCYVVNEILYDTPGKPAKQTLSYNVDLERENGVFR